MKNIQSAIVIGIMCFLLSFGIAVQISSIKNESTVIARENMENELRDDVLKLTDAYNKSYAKLQKSEQKLEALRNSVSENDEISKTYSEELTKINNCLGLTNLTGNGIVIEIESGDLLQILNALNNAGAEAISINDNRVTFFSEIKNDGDIVTLDGDVLEEPFVIKAIGGYALYGAITMPGSYIDNLKNADYEVSVTEEKNIVINKYTGIYNFNFAESIEE